MSGPNTKAAGLVRRWEDCLAPHELPHWAEQAALTMRALVARHPNEHTIVRLAMAVAAVMAEHDRHADAAVSAATQAERKQLDALGDATCPRLDAAIEELVAACRQQGEAPAEEAGGKPAAFMWQHDETGRIGFIDPWQVENGWQEANPRLKIVAPLYRHPAAPGAAAAASAAMLDALQAEQEWRDRDAVGEIDPEWDYERLVGDKRRAAIALAAPGAAAAAPSRDAEQLEAVRQAIRDYHFALDKREHGGEAEASAFEQIVIALRMPWLQGQEAAARAAQAQGGKA